MKSNGLQKGIDAYDNIYNITGFNNGLPINDLHL